MKMFLTYFLCVEKGFGSCDCISPCFGLYACLVAMGTELVLLFAPLGLQGGVFC